MLNVTTSCHIQHIHSINIKMFCKEEKKKYVWFSSSTGIQQAKKKKKEAARVHIKHLKDKKIIEIKSDSYGVLFVHYINCKNIAF